MSAFTRRGFLGATGLAAWSALDRRIEAAKRGPAAAVRAVDLTGDGVGLTPAQYVELLGQLVSSSAVEADEYSRGGAVAALEARFAALLGKETAIFMPSGTLANHLAVRALAGTRRRVIVQETSHLYNDSGDAAQQLSQLNLVPLAPGEGTFRWGDVERVLERSAASRVKVDVGAISIESPVRRLHHATFQFEEMERIAENARARGIGLHLDGARLFVAAAYQRRSPTVYAALFDTVYVSLWKCFNAAIGAVLAGPRALLDEMFHVRRMFGGALWNAWSHAAVAHHYADGYGERMYEAVVVAEHFLSALEREPGFRVTRVPEGTSAFRLELTGGNAEGFRTRLAQRGVRLPPAEAGVFWPRVNETVRRATSDELLAAFRSARGQL